MHTYYSYMDSPIIALSPQDAHQPLAAASFSTSPRQYGGPAHHFDRASPSTPWPPSTMVKRLTTTMNPGRKRTREEIADPADDHPEDGSYFISPSQPEPEPVYGEGMMLLNPRTGQIIDASSQTGTWADERIERTPSPRTVPRLISRKSQRLNAPGIAPLADAVVPASPPKSNAAEPIIDEATHFLGIGWTRLSEQTDMQAAIRGWARYIENHYPISGVNLLLQSKGLNAYLAEAKEGYFLFSEDLNEGRMVGQNWQTTLLNLKKTPMEFEGVDTIKAMRTPEIEMSREQEVVGVAAAQELPAVPELSMDLD